MQKNTQEAISKALKRIGFKSNLAIRELTCCNGWYSPKTAHKVKIGERIYWRTEKGRSMGYCEECAKALAEAFIKQPSLF